MKMLRVTVAPHERALEFRNRGLVRVLMPGVHWIVSLVDELRIRTYDLSTDAGAFTDAEVERLFAANPSVIGEHLVPVELGVREVGLVRRGGVLVDVQRPGTRRLYWRGPYAVEVERIDVSGDPEVPADVARALHAPRLRVGTRAPVAIGPRGDVLEVGVPERSVGLLFVDGAYLRELAPGRHLFWQFDRSVAVNVVDLRAIALDVTGQEILTADRVGVRLNLAATWQVDDPVRVGRELADPRGHVYRETQLALRRAIGTRTLDELLGDKAGLDAEILAEARARLEPYGIRVPGAGVRDVILPGDVRELMNRVVAAEKTAQANNVRRREETAATRSLLNTARLVADNPVLMRLKELEALERVTERVGSLTVHDGLEGVMKGLVRIDG